MLQVLSAILLGVASVYVAHNSYEVSNTQLAIRKAELYPEFNIKNILVLNGTISFIDFGLAEFATMRDNTINCLIFIDLLQQLEERFKEEDCNTRLLYTVFMNNIKVHKIEKYLNNVL